MHLGDPIMVRSTLSGFLSTLLLFFQFFWIVPYYFPYSQALLCYLIISPVPTCLVHNCETSWKLLYFHLLSPLSQDQIPFDPHQQNLGSHCFSFGLKLNSDGSGV